MQTDPQLGLRIVSFKGTTVVVLHWIHLAFDAMITAAILNAWSLMLQGSEDEIPEPLAPDNYILEDIGKNPTTPHVLADQRMSMLRRVSWMLRNVYALVLSPKENRVICMPAAHVAKLKEKAMAELDAQATSTGDGLAPFLSDGDIVVAWATRLFMSKLPRDSGTTVSRLACIPRRNREPLLMLCPQGQRATVVPVAAGSH